MMNCLFRGTALIGAALVTVSVSAGAPALETPVALGPWETQAAPSAKEGPLPEPKADAWKRNGAPHSWGVGNSLCGWLRTTFVLPAESRGSSVVYRSEHDGFDVVVRLNGSRADEVLRPGGELDVTALAKPGATNVLELFATRDNSLVSEKKTFMCHFQHNPNDKARLYDERSMPRVEIALRGADYLRDVYLRPVPGKKRVRAELEVQAQAAGQKKVSLSFADDDGKVVKRVSVPVALKRGLNRVASEFDWPEVEYWSTVSPRVYTVSAEIGGDRFGDFLWGFREIATRGKDILLNGKVHHFRGVYCAGLNGSRPQGGIELYKSLGNNLLYLTHNFDTNPRYAKEFLDAASRAGMAIFIGAPSIMGLPSDFAVNDAAKSQYDRHARHNLAKYRNSPAIVAYNVGVNTYCPAVNMMPDHLGQYHDTTPAARRIDAACDICRKFHPNALYFSHADGSTGDISSNNLYLNMMPLQEREEWLSQWSTNGVMPWYAAEWGQPYYGSWWHMSVNFLMTEWLSVYYGDQAYATEPADCLAHTLKMGQANTSWHGATISEMSVWDYPLFKPFLDMFASRTMRSYRAYGLNGGLMNFNVADGYGKPNPNDNQPIQGYGGLEVLDHRPLWANGYYDVLQRNNHDFVGFIGGADGVHTDRTHAYLRGEEVRKEAVFIWDGADEVDVRAEWRYTIQTVGLPFVTTAATGSFGRRLSTGEILKVPFSFKAANSERNTSPWFPERGRLELCFYEAKTHRLLAADSCEIDTYLELRKARNQGRRQIFVFNPAGADFKGNPGAALLRQIGIGGFKPVAAEEIAKLPANALLVFGKNQLSNLAWRQLSPELLEKGVQVLVFQQRPGVWKALGFEIEDAMARRMWPIGLGGASGYSYDHWRGMPQCDKDTGSVDAQAKTRMAHWTHRHAVSVAPLRIPETLGFEPLVWGEFDMNYAGVLRYRCGKGSVTYCALDFEGRLESDPAACDVAASLMECFTLADAPQATRRLYASGAAAERLLKALHADYEPLPDAGPAAAKESVLVVGEDGAADYAKLKAWMDAGLKVLAVNCDALAESAGLKLGERERFWKCEIKPDDWRRFRECRALAGVARKHLRWRDAMETRRFAADGQPEGWRVYADGLFAVPRKDPGVVFVQVSPFMLTDRFAAKLAADPKDWRSAGAQNTVSLSEEHTREMLGRILLNFGAKPGRVLTERVLSFDVGARGFHSPGDWHILGPFAVPEVKSPEKALVWNADSEPDRMTREAVLNPNPRFRLPQGGEVDWRPSITPDKWGNVDTLKFRTSAAGENKFGAASSVATSDGKGQPEINYYLCEFESDVAEPTEGALHLVIGMPMQMWLNGQVIAKYDRPFETFAYGRSCKTTVKVKILPGRNRIGIKTFCREPLKSNAFAVWLRESADAEVKAAETGPSLYERHYKKFDPYMYVYW